MSRRPLSVVRASRVLISAGILAVVVLWLVSPGMSPLDLGPGDELLGRPGVTRFLVGGPGGWRSFSDQAHSAGEGWSLPAELLGRPALAADGSAMVLLPGGLEILDPDGRRRSGPELPPQALGGSWELIGLDGSDRPVLCSQTGAGRRLLVVADEGGGWRELASPEGSASPPAGAQVLLSTARRALAYRGEQCWEAWVFDENPTRHMVADDCSGRCAVFSPAGDALILDGRTDGIYRLELDSGRVTFMARGNLGSSARVPCGAGFRGDPLLMVAPVRDSEGYLQIVQTHLRGSDRYGITTGAVHHYHAACSRNGRYIAYCQATFDEGGDAPIDEDLYLFDFDVGRAVFDTSRRGGEPLSGPLFVGDAATLVFIADGRVLLLDPGND